MPNLVDAIDTLLRQGGTRGAVPKPDTTASAITGGALALVAIMRTPDAQAARITDCRIDPQTGTVTLQVHDRGHAQALAGRLGLPKTGRATELDHGWVAHRWSGQWADWPVAIVHAAQDPTLAPSVRAQAAGL